MGFICDTLPEQSAVAERVLQVSVRGGSLPIISPYNCFLLWYILFTDKVSMAAWPCFLFYQEIRLLMLIRVLAAKQANLAAMVVDVVTAAMAFFVYRKVCPMK